MKTILILDTDSAQQKQMTTHLSAMGFTARSVFSEAEFDKLSEKPFMIILDEKMVNADRSSLQFLKKVHRKMSSVPIIYMMADAERKSVNEAKKSGAYEVIQKNSAAFVHLRTALDRVLTQPQKSGWFQRLFRKNQSQNLPALSI